MLLISLKSSVPMRVIHHGAAMLIAASASTVFAHNFPPDNIDRIGVAGQFLPWGGFRIDYVHPDGPAAYLLDSWGQRIVAESGDAIVAINGLTFHGPGDFYRILNAGAGQKARITLRDVRTGRNVDFIVWPIPLRARPDRAQSEVNVITRFLGMPYIPTLTASVPNAAALRTTINGRPILVIHYNSNFLNGLDRQYGRWASVSVLAHEVAHHFYGDAGFYGAFAHPWTKELRADFVSGYVLAKAGATVEESTRALRASFSSGSVSHPDTVKRLLALAAGWQKGRFGP